jgi:hypothetical protein
MKTNRLPLIWLTVIILLLVILLTGLTWRFGRAASPGSYGAEILSTAPVLIRFGAGEAVVTWNTPDPQAGEDGMLFVVDEAGKESKVKLEYAGVVDGAMTWVGSIERIGGFRAIGGVVSSRARPGMPFEVQGVPWEAWGFAVPLVVR